MKPPNKTDNKPFKILLIMSTAVILIWGLSAILIFYLGSDWGSRGTMGDMFGAVNALFAGLAFAALIYTIILQQEEIRLNRAEIELNRKELKKSAVAQQSSQQALKDQVVQTHLTAKINAMSTIINYYNTQIANPNNSQELIDKAKLKRKLLIKSIDELIEGMDDSDVDD